MDYPVDPTVITSVLIKEKQRQGESDWVWTVGDVPMGVRGWSDARKRLFVKECRHPLEA